MPLLGHCGMRLMQGPLPNSQAAQIQALADRWLPPSGRALDVGCGPGTEAVKTADELGWLLMGMAL
jgi:hypothetical protein